MTRKALLSLVPAWLAFASLLATGSLALSGCSSDSASVGSTDTGNPPVIDTQSLRVASSADGVVVSAQAGGVPANASVEVTNLSTSDSASTTAEADGSFSVELAGSVDDDYEVAVEVDGKSDTATIAAGSSPADDPFAALVDRDFELESSMGFTPVESTSVQIRIRADSFSFSANCNSFSGPYTFCDGKLCIDGFSATEIGCEAPLADQDSWLADFFSGRPAVTPDGDRVTFASSDASLVFLDSEVANPDRPLTGRVWTIDSFVMGDAVSSLPTPMPPTIEFKDDGSVDVFTVCTNATGSYSVAGDVITLSDLAYPEIGCSTMTQGVHDAMLKVMVDGDVSYQIDAARLWLTRGDYGLGGTTE